MVENVWILQLIVSEIYTCYKNCDDSSSEMESDAILEGFKKAKATHGVRYLRFIGDEDSSVYPILPSLGALYYKNGVRWSCM